MASTTKTDDVELMMTELVVSARGHAAGHELNLMETGTNIITATRLGEWIDQKAAYYSHPGMVLMTEDGTTFTLNFPNHLDIVTYQLVIECNAADVDTIRELLQRSKAVA